MSMKELLVLGKGRYLLRGIVFLVGYILSPLSWWNDLLVNIPLAYGFAELFSLLLGRTWFPVLFAIGYNITNITGILLMELSMRSINTRNLYRDLASSFLYSLIAYLLLSLIM